MEIKTGKRPKADAAPESPVPREKGRSRRKLASQKLRRSRPGFRRYLPMIGMAAKIGVLGLAAWSGFALYEGARNSAVFDLRSLELTGCSHLPPETIRNIVRDEFPENTLRIDLARLERRLEQEAWVRRATVRRELPSGLDIGIEERIPSVIGELRGALVVTDADGVLLDEYDPKYGKLDVPVFRGLEGRDAAGYRDHQEENSARIRLGVQVLDQLRAGSEDLTRLLSEVDLSDPTNVRVLLVDDNAEVILGGKDFSRRFRTFTSNMGQYRKLKSQYDEIASVDLRFEGQIIYRPRRSDGQGTRRSAGRR